MTQNSIQFINEKELHTDVDSNIFYIRKDDLEEVDKLCIENNIDLGDDYSNVLDDRYYENIVPKFIKPFAGAIAIILAILFLLHLAGLI